MKKDSMYFRRFCIGLIMMLFLLGMSAMPAQAEVVFSEDFEAGWGDWMPSNGIWQVGESTSCESQCAGTVLDGNYEAYTDSRLLYFQDIELPAVSGDEVLQLKFQQRFSYSSYDSGQVQVRIWDETAGDWKWENVGGSIVNTSGWSLISIDLTAYAGETIRIGFLHTAGRDSLGRASESTGWYIDDIKIVKSVPYFPPVEDFESGWGDWHATRGVWQTGTSTMVTCFSGDTCAATVLNGNYPAHTDSRLTSPEVQLPVAGTNEEIHMKFMHWFSYSSYDSGQVQVSVWDETEGSWQAWESVGTGIVNTSGWTLKGVDLTAYAGETIRIGFLHTAGRDSLGRASESTGWYIDDIKIVKSVPYFPPVEDFESGWGDWYATRGVWQIGPSPFCQEGNCAGTILNGNYPAHADSTLVSPTVKLPDVNATLKFWQRFSYSSYDSGQVLISVWDDTAEIWQAWVSIGSTVSGVSNVWTPMAIDLTGYAGKKVRIGFLHTAGRDSLGRASESSGWYIDNVEIPGRVINANYYCDKDSDGHFSTTPYGACNGDNCPAECQLVQGDDCNDNDNTAYPGAEELCDNKDNNCEGSVDENVTRETTCGTGECSGSKGTETCTAGVWGNDTCDPLAGAAAEICDDKDNDCDGETDEGLIATYYKDLDADGYGGEEAIQICGDVCLGSGCPTTDSTDCNDNDPDTHPGADDSICNGLDNNCNGEVDEEYVPKTTSCGLGECASTGIISCTDGFEYDSCQPGEPLENPEVTCDEKDNDCDGIVDEGDVCESTILTKAVSFTETFANHPDQNNRTDGWYLHLKADIEDPDGVPINISSVTVNNSDGTDPDTYILGFVSGSTYKQHPEYIDIDSQRGTYRFTVENMQGYRSTMDADPIDDPRQLDVIENLQASDNSTAPSVTFDPVPFADKYRLTIFNEQLDKIYESSMSDSPSFDVPEGVMSDGITYYLRAEAWDINTVDNDGVDDLENRSLNHLRFIPGPQNSRVMGTRALPDCEDPDNDISADIIIDIQEGEEPNGLVVNETIPDGWEISSASHEPGNCVPGDINNPCTGTVSWVFFGNNVKDMTITYTVHVPGSEVEETLKSFSGELLYNDPNGIPVTLETAGDLEIEIGCPCHFYDTNRDFIIGDFELLNAIDDWAEGRLDDFGLLDVIDLWSAGCYHRNTETGFFRPGCLNQAAY